MISKWLEMVKRNERDLIMVIVIISVSLIGFNLGRLSVINDSVHEIEFTRENLPTAAAKASTEAQYVGSRGGSVYHLTNCPGAKAIKGDNKITFNSIKEAETAGYRPAANCPGLD